jgi:transcriptional regulator with XRE-family HTH domain
MTAQAISAGATLRVLRNLAGMTLEDVASAAGTSVAYLSKVETGKFIPTKSYIGQVTAVLAERMKSAA